MAAATPAQDRWLIGPLPDLLLGCGGLYLAVFVAFSVAGPELRGLSPAALLVFLTLVLSAPHYGATLTRVYEQRADRRRYAFFTVWATLAVFAAFVAGLHSITVASALFTIFLIWSPWHYTGQNYGLAVMFLRRRGVPLDAGTKRLVYLSFMLSYVLLVLVLYTGQGQAGPFARGYGASGQESIHILDLGIPGVVASVGVPLVTAGYLGVLVAAGLRLLRHASPRDLLPSSLLALTQALWFSLPVLVQHVGVPTGLQPLDPAHRVYIFTWIALGHAIQYLWVTSYYARSAPGWHGTGRYLAKVLVAGTALWTLPLVLFASWSLGGISGDAGFYLLLSSCINIHHFILDGAIWKLRDSRIAGVLLRKPERAGPEPIGTPGARWGRRLVWGVAGAGAALAAVHFVLEARLLDAGERRDPWTAASVLDGLDWFGQDSARERKWIAKAHLDAGRRDEAARQLARSLALQPDARGYAELARIHEGRGDLPAALAALDEGLRLEPDQIALLHRAGEVQLSAGRPDLAVPPLERALAVEPGHPATLRALARARRQLRDRPPPEG